MHQVPLGHRALRRSALRAAVTVFTLSSTVGATGGSPLDFYGLGVNVGAAEYDGDGYSLLFGGEASMGHLSRRFIWMGAYTDAVYHGAASQGRFSIGPELGFGPFGMDVGYAAAVGRGGFQSGLVVRGLLTMGWVSAYYRYGHFGEAQSSFSEVGVLLKVFGTAWGNDRYGLPESRYQSEWEPPPQ